MKKELVVMSLFLIIFFSSCELKYTQYEIGIFNQSSYTLIVEYETIEGKETVKLEKEKWDLHSGQNQKDWSLKIPEAVYWSPDNPHLYTTEIKVHQSGKLSDTWTTRFGMRELTIKNKDFYLNGKRIYIKASFFEGLYPNGIASPDSEEMARREIRLAKEAGFNLIRPWRRPPVPMWLDLADEMGVLVGKPAPDFDVAAVLGTGEIVDSYKRSEAMAGKFGLVFFYPLDFTLVCPSELLAFDHRIEEFKKRNV